MVKMPKEKPERKLIIMPAGPPPHTHTHTHTHTQTHARQHPRRRRQSRFVTAGRNPGRKRPAARVMAAGGRAGGGRACGEATMMEAPRIARGSGQGVRAEGQGRGSRQGVRAQGISAGGATREADGGEGAVEEARVGKGAARDVHLGGRAAGGRDADLRIASAEQGRTGRHGSRWLQRNTPGSIQTLLLLRSSIQPIR